MKKYEIVETTPKQDGTKVYCINKNADNQPYLPYMVLKEQIFKGTYEECVRKLNELEVE